MNQKDSSEGGQNAGQTGSPKKVLVVDDEPQIVEMITMRLEAAGFEVFSAGNGVEGLEQVRHVGPDLIISDVVMPEMDGYHFYKKLKESPATEDIPVLILTAHGKMEDTFAVAGVDAFIPKPFDSQDFLAIVQKLTKHKHAPLHPKNDLRVLLAGDSQETVENMALQLKKRNCVVDMVTTSPQVITKAVLFLPKVLIIDVLMDGMTSAEVIKVLTQMPQCANMRILTYSFYRVDELGSEDIRQKALSVGDAQSDCEESGAMAHLGRFNEHSFLDDVEPYLSDKEIVPEQSSNKDEDEDEDEDEEEESEV